MEHGIELKDYYEKAPNNSQIANDIVNQIIPDMKEVKNPIYGDFVLIDLFGLPSHVGVCLGGNKFLHTKRTTGSIVDSLDRWKNRIVKYYRPIND